MFSQFPADLYRAQHWRFRTGAKDQRTTITSGQAKQFARPFGAPKLFGCAHDLPQPLHLLALFGGEQFGVTDDVDKKDMPDLQLDLFFNLSRHD
jgi:hypothetical protein